MASLLNEKNQYITVGVLRTIEPISRRKYTSKKGEEKEVVSRQFVVRNKYKKNNRWRVTDFVFEANDESVLEMLNLLQIGQEIIVSWSVNSYEFQDKHSLEMVTKNNLSAWNIILMKENPVKSEWWNDKNWDFVKKEGEYKPSKLPSHQEKINHNPDNKRYHYKRDVTARDFTEPSVESDEPIEDDELPF